MPIKPCNTLFSYSFLHFVFGLSLKNGIILAGYFSKLNDRIYEFYKKYPASIIPFFRLNPKTKWRKEYEKRVLQGFMGIKLHPRSQEFGIASNHVRKIYELAEKNRLPVLIHEIGR